MVVMIPKEHNPLAWIYALNFMIVPRLHGRKTTTSKLLF
jgi:hypothetical protein